MSDTKNPNPPEEDQVKDDQVEAKDEEEDEGGETDTGAMAVGDVEVSEGFYAYMASIGASVSQISEILKSWRHIQGKGLFRALIDFAGRKSRASAHAEVEIKKDKDFGLLHNFLNQLKSLRKAPTQEHVQKSQADMHKRSGPGSNGPSL